jgi:hypothetical protein
MPLVCVWDIRRIYHNTIGQRDEVNSNNKSSDKWNDNRSYTKYTRKEKCEDTNWQRGSDFVNLRRTSNTMAKWKRTHNDRYTETLVFALELRSGYHSSCIYLWTTSEAHITLFCLKLGDVYHNPYQGLWYILRMSQTQTRGMMYSSNVSHTNKIYSLKFYEKHKVDDIFPRMSHSTRSMSYPLCLSEPF